MTVGSCWRRSKNSADMGHVSTPSRSTRSFGLRIWPPMSDGRHSFRSWRTREDGRSSREIDALRAYATVIEGVLHAALQVRERGELAEQLQHALDHRVVIERAVGVTMGRDGIDAVTAFNKLRHVARSSERRVADVAA